MSDPRVVNLRTLDAKDLAADIRRVDRGSTWGNPYKISTDASRNEVIDLYRIHMNAKISANPLWLEPLRGKRLACWCAPLKCHANVILEWLDSHPR